jgi:hypothetical protein
LDGSGNVDIMIAIESSDADVVILGSSFFRGAKTLQTCPSAIEIARYKHGRCASPQKGMLSRAVPHKGRLFAFESSI